MVGDDGVLVVDPIGPEASRELAAAIRRVAPEARLRAVAYSHDHADHASGAPVLFEALNPAPILAHERAAEKIAAREDPDLPAPDVTIAGSDPHRLDLGGRRVELRYLGKSHSDNMLVTYLPGHRIVFAVDFVSNDRVGYRDLPDYHWPELLEVMRRLQELDYETIVFGHGPPGGRETVDSQIAYYEALREAVAGAVEQGLSEDEAAERVELHLFAHWGGYEEWFELNVRAMYRFLTEGDGVAGEPAAATEEPPRYTIEQFLATTNVAGASFSPDGEKILVSSDESGIYNAYAIPVGDPDAEPVQLTRSTDDAVFVAGYFPEDERFLYFQDRGGNELDHLYVRETDGEVVDLTPGEDLKATFYGWADDDDSFFLGTTERDPRFFDIYEVAADGYERTLVFRDTVGYAFAGASPDGQLLALGKSNDNADSDIFLYDRETEELRHLTLHEGDVQHGFQDFGPDGRHVYLTTNEGHEFSYLVRQDLETGERETVLRPDWDVWYAYFSERVRYLVVGINEDARTRIRVFETPGMEEVELPDLSGLDITSVSFSRDDQKLAFYASSGRNPRNLYVAEVSESGVGEPRRLTSTLSPEIDPEHLVEPEVVRFPSYDGTRIPGILYRPHEAGPERRVPAIVWVHGGPGGQSRVGWNELIQYLVNHGYGVYAINNRGSSGYGKTFFHMDDRVHGDADLDDVVASKGMLAETGWVDSDRIGILGGSYGGYMTLAALTFRPEAFAAGVDLFGISNWHRTVTNIPPWWESFREALEDEMGDFDDEAFFKAKSPLFHADSIRRPLMVLQGANDPRVLKVESDEIVEAARANGVPVEYVLFEDEGHGFVKKENKEEGWRRILAFLDEHLKGVETPEAAPGQ